MIKMIKIKKKIAALLITGLVFAVVTFIHLLGIFNYLENKSYDMRVRFWADSTYSTLSGNRCYPA